MKLMKGKTCMASFGDICKCNDDTEKLDIASEHAAKMIAAGIAIPVAITGGAAFASWWAMETSFEAAIIKIMSMFGATVGGFAVIGGINDIAYLISEAAPQTFLLTRKCSHPAMPNSRS